MSEIIRWIMELMVAHGPLSVFVGVILESVIVPIPSPLIIMGAGALLMAPGLSWSQAFVEITYKVVIPGATASTIGAFFAYGVAYWGGKPLFDRWQGFLGFGWDQVLAAEKRLSGHAAWMIMVLRALPIVPLSLVSAAAGGLRMSVFTFSWATLAGSIPRCYFLGVLGYLMRDSYENLAHHVNRMESLISATIVASAVFLVFYLRRKFRP